MAQQTYDPDSDERYSPGHLREAEQAASQDPYDREFNNIASNYGDSTEHPLGDQETAATAGATASSTAESASQTESSSADDTVGEKGYTGGSKKKGLRSKLAGLSRGRKALLIAAGGGGGGVIGMIVLLFILASSLTIPNLMQNITTYEFARATRQFSESANRVTTEKLAADALEDSTWKSTLQDKYQNLRDNTWGKFDKYRPAKVMQNLQSENNFQLNYRTTALGRQQLIGVTLGDETHLVVQQSARTRFVPGLSSIIDFKNQVNLSQRVSPALDAALRDQDVGPIIRGAVAKDIRQQLGISLTAWTLGKFKGKSLDDNAPPKDSARVAETEERAQTIDKAALTSTDEPKTASLKEAVDDARQTAQESESSDAEVAQAIRNGGVFQSIKDKVGSAVATSRLDTAVGFINPIYKVALPVCIVFDGSLEQSGPTINQQTTQQASTYYYYSSAADQLKNGSTTNDPTEANEIAIAAGATTASLGDTSKSNAIVRASGGDPDTSNTPSAESSAGGVTTLVDATPGLNAIPGVKNLFDNVLGPVCPKVTDIKIAAGVGIATIIASLPDGEADVAAIDGAAEPATNLLADEAANASGNILSKAISGTTSRLSKLADFGKDTTKSAAKLTLATVAAKLFVYARSGQTQSGMAQDTDAANEADAGGNVVAQMQSQHTYGRPLTQAEVAQSDADDQAMISKINSSKSMYDRYFATSNAQSLVDRMAMGVNANANSSIVHSIINIASMLFRPVTYFGSITTALNGNAHAALDDYHYGNVQIGFSDAEEKLIDSTPSYKNHLENQAQLDASGQEGAIANHYNDCFTKQIGDLLSSGEIVRDSDGNVVSDQGLCSPDNLGVNNSDSSSPCGSSGCGDLVFRYRVAMSTNQTVDQLLDEQTVSADTTSSATSSSGSVDTPTGNVQTLAKQVLANPNISFQNDNGAKQDVEAAASGQKITPGPLSDGSSGLPACEARTPVYMNAAILQVALNLAQKYKYQINDMISGHACDTGQHPLGRAMDLFYIAGQPLNDSWWSSSANVATVNGFADIVHSTGSYQFGFGVGCSAVSKIHKYGNLVTFLDSCNPQDEIHIDARGAP